jgi:hypothetical protein
VVRDGVLGTLSTPAGMLVRLRVTGAGGYDEAARPVVLDTTLRLDAFGSATDSARFGPASPSVATSDAGALGWWRVGAAGQRGAALAEYRAPEFRVTLAADSAPRFLGDTVRARVTGALLFDAPMAGAAVRWHAALEEAAGLDAPGLPNLADGWVVGDAAWPELGSDPDDGPRREERAGELTLDRRGEGTLAVPTTAGLFGRPGRLRLDVAVTDVNRQTVTRSTSVTVHAASVYLAARDSAQAWVWSAGVPRTVQVLARGPEGRPAPATRVHAAVVALRWARPTGGGWPWRWLADTVWRDTLTVSAGADTARIRVTPPARAGMVAVVLTARDAGGRQTTTVVRAQVVGGERAYAWWGPSPDPVRLSVLPARRRAAPGDTVDVRFDSPFDSAEAWVTIERERVLRAWRLRVPRGARTVRVPVLATDAPNVFVGVLLVRRAPALAGEPVEARLRAGYGALTVDPVAQRLAVHVDDVRADRRVASLRYAPGDTARLRIRVRDAAGRPAPATVALWAVDEGVLSLTGLGRPSVLDSLYQVEGLGLRLGSTLTRLGTARPPWVSGGGSVQVRAAAASARRDANGVSLEAAMVTGAPPPPPASSPPPPAAEPTMDSGSPDGGSASTAVRTRFRSTAFFLGAVRTDARGDAEASPVLPDNLTTFRVTAVAVAAGDAYGDTDTPLVATKPLTVRAALPRFVRPGDSLSAGGVVTLRDSAGAVPGPGAALRVRADARGLVRVGGTEQTGPPPAAGGTERRWAWRVPADADTGTARVRLTAELGTLRDAVEVALPVRAAYVPRAHVAAGAVGSAGADVRLVLPGRSRPGPLAAGAAGGAVAHPRRARRVGGAGCLPVRLHRAAGERGARARGPAPAACRRRPRRPGRLAPRPAPAGGGRRRRPAPARRRRPGLLERRALDHAVAERRGRARAPRRAGGGRAGGAVRGGAADAVPDARVRCPPGAGDAAERVRDAGGPPGGDRAPAGRSPGRARLSAPRRRANDRRGAGDHATGAVARVGGPRAPGRPARRRRRLGRRARAARRALGHRGARGGTRRPARLPALGRRLSVARAAAGAAAARHARPPPRTPAPGRADRAAAPAPARGGRRVVEHAGPGVGRRGARRAGPPRRLDARAGTRARGGRPHRVGPTPARATRPRRPPACRSPVSCGARATRSSCDCAWSATGRAARARRARSAPSTPPPCTKSRAPRQPTPVPRPPRRPRRWHATAGASWSSGGTSG